MRNAWALRLLLVAATMSMANGQTASPSTPNIAAVVNGASFFGASIQSPGALVAIFGTNLGPNDLAENRPDADGRYAEQVGNVSVYLNDVRLPIVYAQSNQVGVFFPYTLPESGVAFLRVEYQALSSAEYPVFLVRSSPGLFARNNGGTGGLLALNQDLSPNLPGRPAAKGSAIMLFATGVGRTNPSPAQLGRATGLSSAPQCTFAMVGSARAGIEYAGHAEGLLNAIVQINIRLPDDAPAGDAVPVRVYCNGNPSQTLATISIQ